MFGEYIVSIERQVCEISPFSKTPLVRETWTRNGLIDRPLGPAVIVKTPDNQLVREEWYKAGRVHRVCGAAITDYSASIVEQKLYRDGLRHRGSAPAVVLTDKASGIIIREEWFLNGIETRDGGPSCVHRDGNFGIVEFERWKKGGRLHRLDGPAVVERHHETGKLLYEGYFLDDQEIDEAEIERAALTLALALGG